MFLLLLLLYTQSSELRGVAAEGLAKLMLLLMLLLMLHPQSSELRGVAAEGLAKLMLCGRVLSARLLSRLVLLWYNPITEDDNRLRHCLGAFFPIFAFAGQYVFILMYRFYKKIYS